jgi:hypothetical protein
VACPRNVPWLALARTLVGLVREAGPQGSWGTPSAADVDAAVREHYPFAQATGGVAPAARAAFSAELLSAPEDASVQSLARAVQAAALRRRHAGEPAEWQLVDGCHALLLLCRVGSEAARGGGQSEAAQAPRLLAELLPGQLAAMATPGACKKYSQRALFSQVLLRPGSDARAALRELRDDEAGLRALGGLLFLVSLWLNRPQMADLGAEAPPECGRWVRTLLPAMEEAWPGLYPITWPRVRWIEFLGAMLRFTPRP